MKTFFRIGALCLAMILSLSMLVSCLGGKSMDDIVDKIKDLDEDDYIYEKASKEGRKALAGMLEEEMDLELEGDILTSYNVYSAEDHTTCMIMEFEEAADAKEAVKAMQEWVEDQDEDDLGCDPEDFIIERSGNIVIYCNDEDLVDEIW